MGADQRGNVLRMGRARVADAKTLRTPVPRQLHGRGERSPDVSAAAQALARYRFRSRDRSAKTNKQVTLASITGRIVNIGMFAGERNNPEPGLAMYSGTKYAVEGLSEALRFELSRFGIGVSVVQPDVSFLDSCFLDEHHM